MGVSIYPTNPKSLWSLDFDLFSTHITASTWQHILNQMPDREHEDVWMGIVPIQEAIDDITTARRNYQDGDPFMDDKFWRYTQQLALQWREAQDDGATEIRWS